MTTPIVNEFTPLMKQYHDIKVQHADALLLFQVGDFYELFFDDAKKAAAALGIALTARGKVKGEPIPLCGVPVHALDYYLAKLVKAGFNVALCDQLQEPQPGKVVERGITQVLTPGTLTDSKLLDEKSASYLLSFFPLQDSWGLLFGELLTAQLFATVLPTASEKVLESELIRFFPDEILVPQTNVGKTFQPYFNQRGYFTTFVATPAYDSEQAKNADAWMQQQFQEKSLAALQRHDAVHQALMLFYCYVHKNQEAALEHFKQVQFYQPDDFLILDAATQRNLELIKNVHDGSRKNTLFAVMDHAATSMGSRMIKKWLLRPLIEEEPIVQRQDAIAQFIQDPMLLHAVEQLLNKVGDIERVVGRIALNRGHQYDYCMLMHSLELVPQFQRVLGTRKNIALFMIIANSIEDFQSLHHLLQTSLNEDPAKPWKIKPGFDQPLDQLRDLVAHAHQKIMALEQQEQQATGINSLKIRYNQAHGYYIEITKANLDAVPERYKRKMTLVGKERFITNELSQLQHEIFSATNDIDTVEATIFERVKHEVALHIGALRKLAHALAHLDALLSFGRVAYINGYVRPQFNAERIMLIESGRHPVVEQALERSFIPNDTRLTQQESLWIITGPNMGGKSTYLRQVALIAVMAQCGSFVPVSKASLSLLDRIFTRIGAGDNVAEGKSTFLVEMEEVAVICSQATQRSLVILDEVGRGTSTFDGLAIAQAVVEYIYTKVQARCLFATHYHELTQLQEQLPGIVSYYAASKKTPQGIVFLYKIYKGVADGSFGVEVAKLAQLPKEIIARSEQILQVLSQTEVQHSKAIRATQVQQANELPEQQYERLLLENQQLHAQVNQMRQQLQAAQQQLEALRSIDYDNLSPKKAFDVLWMLKEK